MPIPELRIKNRPKKTSLLLLLGELHYLKEFEQTITPRTDKNAPLQKQKFVIDKNKKKMRAKKKLVIISSQSESDSDYSLNESEYEVKTGGRIRSGNLWELMTSSGDKC
ncbi:hypothetical protein FQR65_LT08879 [Abscondita terminalis]|nr:hypothetical protein FQR65_LT08879 [Abscondita terminalis]